MKKWCKWFVGVLLVCSACSSTNNVECVVSEFEEEGVLVAKEHIIPEPILLPRYIGITGDYLYVYKEREYLFHSCRRFALLGCRCQRENGQPNDLCLLHACLDGA